jgi:hypothetical protein
MGLRPPDRLRIDSDVRPGRQSGSDCLAAAAHFEGNAITIICETGAL